ncbi:MAG: hypothetical protein IKV03_03985 [Alphaproteobacteria bacterium]|nr:hypothetical protein [Alphaproteobacteria bacterium]
MKKAVILIVIACLGLGSGAYVAHKTQSKNLTQIFANKTQPSINGPWVINHPNWTGRLTKTGENRIVSNVNGDTATIISNQNGLLTIKWDKWGNETFKCDNKNICTLK